MNKKQYNMASDKGEVAFKGAGKSITFDLQKKLQDTDFRASCVLIGTGIVVGLAWWFNATLVYDDIALPGNFSSLVNQIGWFKALIKIFCLDFPNEYRTYGLSRVTQFLIWSLGGANAPVYTVLISLSQIVTVLVLYALLVSLSIERIIALSLGLMWLFSPFIWTSCFHHYSYLILPAQITIIGSYFLVTRNEVKQEKLLAVCIGIGVALALTGELHLIAVPFALIVIAVASGVRSTLRASFLVISSMMLTIATHYSIWKTFVADNSQRQRFTLSWSHDTSYWSYRVFVAVRGVGRSIVEQLREIADHDILWLITATIISSLVVFSILAWVLDKRDKGVLHDEIHRRSSLSVAGILFMISCLYLTMFIMIVVLTDSVPSTMHRRYGFIPLTIMLSAISFAVSALVSRRLSKMLVLSVLIGVMISLFVRHQVIILPATRAADDKLSEMISNELKADPTKGVLFFSASKKPFTRSLIDGATPGPAMRDTTSSEVTQAKYGNYLPAWLTITIVIGAPFMCELESIRRDGKLSVRCPPWQVNPGGIDGSKVIIVANLGFDEYDPLGKQVRVFRNYHEFESYFFSKQIGRGIDWVLLSSDVVAIDLGSSILLADIVGNWKVGVGVGKIEGSDGSNLLVTTETGLKSTGKITGDRIDVASWNVTGRLTADKNRIIWSNTVVWTR